MKNPLKAIPKESFKEAGGEIAKFVTEHQSLIYTSGTIACNAAGIAVTFRNAPKIQEIIFSTKSALAVTDDEEDKKKIIKASLKELVPLMTPIILFFFGSTTLAVLEHRKNQEMKKTIASLTASAASAMALAQNTMTQYENFQKEVKDTIGEEKFKEIKTEAEGKRIEEDRQNNKVPHMGQLGEVLICIPDFGVYFYGTSARIDMALDHVNQCLKDNGLTGRYSYGNENELGGEIVFVDNLFDELGINDDQRPKIARQMGWDAQHTTYVSYWVGDGHTNSGIPYLTLEFNEGSKPYFIEPTDFIW